MEGVQHTSLPQGASTPMLLPQGASTPRLLPQGASTPNPQKQ